MKYFATIIAVVMLAMVMTSCAGNGENPVQTNSDNASVSADAQTQEGSLDENQSDDSEDITEQANDIINQLASSLEVTDNILSRQNIKYDSETITASTPDGNSDTYYKYPSPYDTVDACMSAMKDCYTDEMCEKIRTTFFDMSNENRWLTFYVADDGSLYVPDGEIYHTLFTTPIASAEKSGEDKIIAKTTVIEQTGTSDFEIVLKKENDEWKVDGYSIPGSEASIYYAKPEAATE